MRSTIWLGCAFACASASANEVTVKNDSLVDNSSGTIQAGFAAGERASSWLTSPCDGNIVAAQVFWRSLTGGTAASIEDSIEISRAGTYPIPGTSALIIGGPQLTDGVINEFRYTDENNTIPVSVPVTLNETFVVTFTFAQAPDPDIGPSLVSDSGGIQPNRNAIYGDIGLGSNWYSSSSVGISGDWVIRAVINCAAVNPDADVAATMSATPTQYTAGAALQYTITLSNAGPSAAASTTVVDIFPAAFSSPIWTCAASGGASCAASGSGNITGTVSLPAGGSVAYTVNGTVANGTTGALSNTVTAVVGAPATDPNTANNTAILSSDPAVSDVIFANGFDAAGGIAPLLLDTPAAIRPARAFGTSRVR